MSGFWGLDKHDSEMAVAEAIDPVALGRMADGIVSGRMPDYQIYEIAWKLIEHLPFAAVERLARSWRNEDVDFGYII
jgi:hypothetical protein